MAVPRIRENWKEKLEGLGFHFYEMDGETYWDESAYYLFEPHEIDHLEEATNELYDMCLIFVDRVIRERLYSRMGIPEKWADYIEASWKKREPTIYGRFDLWYDGRSEPKLLEFNADTPTALFEASVVQYFWLQDFDHSMDQFNSIHERLLEVMKKDIKRFVSFNTLYFSCVQDSVEDLTTVEYLRDTAIQAWLATGHIYIDHVGYDHDGAHFVDTQDNPIRYMFKLYPWEWLIREEFALFLEGSGTRLLEPPWKMILSNKAALPLLWEMYPNHKNLLPAYFEPPNNDTLFVEKPFFSREGEGIAVDRCFPGGKDQVMYQEYRELPRFSGNYPVVGSWIIGDEAAGIGIREDTTPITNNLSRFVPHLFG